LLRCDDTPHRLAVPSGLRNLLRHAAVLATTRKAPHSYISEVYV
jgi:hypothetical protein